MMNGSGALAGAMVVVMVVMCGGMIWGAGITLRRHRGRNSPSANRH
jgi:type II secretory pathway component PulK